MTEKEIETEQQQIRARIKVLKEEWDELNRKLEYGHQSVCPHPENRRFHSWGQYLPSEIICNICNKVLN